MNPDWYKQTDQTKYEPKWEREVDYNPDHHPSFTPEVTTLLGNRVVRMWQIRGLGVIMADLHSDEQGRLYPQGISIFSKEDIGWAPKL